MLTLIQYLEKQVSVGLRDFCGLCVDILGFFLLLSLAFFKLVEDFLFYFWVWVFILSRKDKFEEES